MWVSQPAAIRDCHKEADEENWFANQCLVKVEVKRLIRISPKRIIISL
jgi:hypothetical protein